MSDDSGTGHRVLPSPKNARLIEKVNACLQDANRSLLVVDKQLKQSKEMTKEKAARNEMLMDDVALRSKQLWEEKQKMLHQGAGLGKRGVDEGLAYPRRRHHTVATPLTAFEGRGVESDMEYGRQSRPDVFVRFFDDMDAGRHIHSLHQSIRDLGSEQKRFQDELQMRRNAELGREGLSQNSASRKPSSLPNKQEVDEAVARRLEAIRNERNEEKLRNKQIELGISAELKQALNRLKQGDVDVKQSASLNMLRDYQKHLNKFNDENRTLKLLVKQLQEQILKWKQSETDQEWRKREKDELRELKSQLARCSPSVAESIHLRQELEKSEQQKMQFADHVETLKKELESKEKYIHLLLQQLQETVDGQREAEATRQHAVSSQRDLESCLGEADRRLQTANVEMNALRAELQAAYKKNEDLKVQAQQTVRLWKQKNQKLEKFRDLYEDAKSQNGRLARDLEHLKSREDVSVHSVDKIKRDMKELLGSNVQLTEQVHLKDVQLSELIASKMDLTKDLLDSKSIIERLENELHVANEKTCLTNQSRILLEDQLNAAQSSKLKSKNMIQHLQRELSDVTITRKELMSQISQLQAKKEELELNLQDLKQMYLANKEESLSMEQRLKEELNHSLLMLEAAKKEVSRLQERDSGKVKELTVRLKKDQAEYTAEVQSSKLEIDEQRATIRLLKKQINDLQEEIKRLSDALVRKEEENSFSQQKLAKIHQQFLANSYLTEEGLTQGRELELQLLDSKEELVWQKKNHMNVLLKVAQEVDDLIYAALGEGHEKFKLRIKASTSDSDGFLIDLQNQLDKAKAELRERHSRATQGKVNLQDVANRNERERQIIRQANKQDGLLHVNYEMPLSLTNRMSSGKSQPLEQKLQDVSVPHNLPNNFDHEREQIHRRYEKRQEAMNFLKQELFNQKLYPSRGQTPESDLPMCDLGMR